MLPQRLEPPLLRYPWVNHDALELLLTGRQITSGEASLYRDVWDPNFPAIHTLTILANEFWRSDPVGAFHAGVLLLGWLGGCWLLIGLRRASLGTAIAILGACGLELLCPAVPVMQDFGQREQLFALVLMPWLAWRLGVCADPPWWLRLPLAFVTGWLGTIKPTFLLVPVAVELVAGRLARRLGKADLGAAAAGVVTPWMPFLLLDPGAIRDFVFDILPVHLTPWYRLGFGIPWHEVWRRPQALVALPASALLWWLISRGRRRGVVGAAEARGWIAASLAAAIGVAVQGTGFSYHFIPLQAVIWLGLASVGTRVVGGRPVAAFAVAGLLLGWSSFTTTVRGRRREPSGIVRIIPRGSPVLVLSTDVMSGYDVWYQHWRSPRGRGAMVLLEGRLRDPDPLRRAAGLAAERDRILAAMRANPEFIIVRHSAIRGYADLEDALIRVLRVLPVPGWRRMSDGDVERLAGPDDEWAVYRRRAVR